MEGEKKNEEGSSEEEEEEILVYVNFSDPVDDYSKEDLLNSKILGLDTDEPILQIGNKIFGGSWNNTVGTALFFEETAPLKKRCFFSETVTKPLAFCSKTNKSLNLKRVFISEKISEMKEQNINTEDIDISDD